MKTVAIFGATSAIAEHVARLYAVEGARLFLAGRDAQQLEHIAQDLQVRGAENVLVYAIDFNRIDNFEQMLDACERELGPADVALVAFGLLGDQKGNEQHVSAARAVLETNLVSPACLLGELAKRMEQRRAGTIAAISSVAGDRGRQSNYVYGAAKAGLSTFLAGLRHRLAASGVSVIDIKPGFVDTPMTADIVKGGPLWATPDRVAIDIRRALDRGSSTVYTPWFWRHIMRVVRLVPEPIFHKTKL